MTWDKKRSAKIEVPSMTTFPTVAGSYMYYLCLVSYNQFCPFKREEHTFFSKFVAKSKR